MFYVPCVHIAIYCAKIAIIIENQVKIHKNISKVIVFIAFFYN